MPEISIIIPVYRVEDYLRQCVDSILAQTFSDIEVILVDDGSPDACGTICDQYAEKDARVKVIHKPNGGVSSARNAGLEAATGSLIGFVDGDDYVAPDMYEFLRDKLLASGADIAACGAYMCFQNHTILRCKRNFHGLVNTETAYKLMLEGNVIHAFVTDKLYRRHCFDKIRYPQGMTFEDIYIYGDLMRRVSGVYIDTTPKYYYVQRGTSIVNQSFTPKDFNIIRALEHNREIIRTHYPALQAHIDGRILREYRFVFNKLWKGKRSDPQIRLYKQDVSRRLRKSLGDFLKNHTVSKKDKGLLLFIAICPWFYELLAQIKAKKEKLM